jgi:adenine-specific DNA-methyltransferase
LAQWAIKSPDTKILEPSCGDGVLLQSAIETLIKLGIDISKAVNLVHGVEIDKLEAAKASKRITSLTQSETSVEIHNGDFFSYCKKQLAEKPLFDAVIGNPPFIRYQNFPEDHRIIAFELMRCAGLKPNRLTNSWVPFLVATTLLLKKTGRMAMVVPAELLQVNYTAELRCFLSQYYSSITLITFRKLVFEGIQQEVILLLGERNGQEHTGIRVIELNGLDDLENHIKTIPDIRLKEMDHSTEKWTMYFLNEDELQLIRRLKNHPLLTLSGEVIGVDVGIVTGQNKFFVLREDQIDEFGLGEYSQHIVGRSTYLRGAVFSNADWQDSVEKQAGAFLLKPPNVPLNELTDQLKNYIAKGEKAGVNSGYKCRIRKQWYIVPSVWTPDAFMLRQVHKYPKIVLNNANATCTDTIHRVCFRKGAKAETVTSAFLNSLTFAFSEITGRSYGGGVLELEPNEAEKLPMPLVGANELKLDEIDRLLRKEQIESVLDITDEILLKRGLDLSTEDVSMLRTIWKKLRDRRINRKHSRSN